ncbi:MAG: hypothetical protein LBG07_06325 [Treponema sp.]|nr:hypothetical protein [Treponema sp.]
MINSADCRKPCYKTQNEKDNLSKTERNEIAKMIVRLKQGLKEMEDKK